MNESVITLVGSMKFYDVMISEGERLSKLGFTVLHPFRDDRGVYIPTEALHQYDLNIRKMIDMSDIVYVINENNYIGKSTASEIKYAEDANKRIEYYWPAITIPNDRTIEKIVDNNACPTVTLVGSRRFAESFAVIDKILTSWGCIVLVPSIFKFSDVELSQMSSSMHQLLDTIHRRKMVKSNYVLVVDNDVRLISHENCYVGHDTLDEIKFAKSSSIHTLRYSEGGLAQIINDIIMSRTPDVTHLLAE